MRNIILMTLFLGLCQGQLYRGAELRTLEPVLYGKFEARYKPAQGDGVLSSFFTYNDSCCSETPWNEIDIELLGRYDHVIDFNTITWGQSSHIRQHYIPFNPHVDFHSYGFEWTPDYVAWFIDGEEVYRQTGGHIDELHYSQKIMMNIWNPVYDDWVGAWDERVLPRFAFYDHVSYASYTPGEGNIGTDSNFTFMWQDDFNVFDSNRWEKSHDHTWGGNQSLFIEDNVVFQDGYMILCLTNITETGMVDNTIPSALWAMHHGDFIDVRFSEELSLSSAEQINNYSLAGVTFDLAELMEDQRTVKLTMNTDQFDATTMGVFNIEDDNEPPNIVDWQIVWIDSPEPMSHAMINVGGDSVSIYANDQVWGPSRQYGHEGGNYQVIDESIEIDGTTNDAIYRSSLNRVAGYKVRLTPGFYNLNLMFSDNHYSDPGDRIFDIMIEDSLWVNDLDVIDEVGSMAAHEVLLERILVEDGTLDIYFSAETYGVGYTHAGPFLNGMVIGLDEALSITTPTPEKFHLRKPYPNPFNNNLKIPIELMEDSQVRIDVMDVSGRMIDMIFDGKLTSGSHLLEWNSKTHSSGMYVLKINIDQTHHYEKTILLK